MSKNLHLTNETLLLEQSFLQQKQHKPIKLTSIKIVIPKRNKRKPTKSI